MSSMQPAHFFIKNRFQKRSETYEDILTPDILEDVCVKATGQANYTVTFDDSAINRGRLATIEFQGQIIYISFSESIIRGRNASLQSFPSALVYYHNEQNINKRVCFYFLKAIGNFKTPYFLFMYRLMKTAGTEFLNELDYLPNVIVPFTTVEDIILNKNVIRGANRSNNSTYLTKDANSTLQIFGKTYGASKYETTLLCLSIAKIATSKIELYEIQENKLKRLPKAARQVIEANQKITIITSVCVRHRTYTTYWENWVAKAVHFVDVKYLK